MAAVDLTGTPFIAGSTVRYSAVLRDEDGLLLPASALSSLTLTLINPYSGSTVNQRDGQDVLNANGGVVDGSGRLTVHLGPADTAKQTTLALEKRRMLFEWVYGGQTGDHVVDIGLTEE